MSGSVQGMKGAIENHLTYIGTQITTPTMLFFERGSLFSPGENNTQVDVGLTPPSSHLQITEELPQPNPEVKLLSNQTEIHQSVALISYSYQNIFDKTLKC